jgi:hypothetical protein
VDVSLLGCISTVLVKGHVFDFSVLAAHALSVTLHELSLPVFRYLTRVRSVYARFPSERAMLTHSVSQILYEMSPWINRQNLFGTLRTTSSESVSFAVFGLDLKRHFLGQQYGEFPKIKKTL